MERVNECIKEFGAYLKEGEKSSLTIEKYLRDARCFLCFVGEREITKQIVTDYREYLRKTNSAASVNTALSSVNGFLEFSNLTECKVKLLKIQRRIFSDTEKELSETEYRRLVAAARDKGNERLALIMQTICSTGIRVSELRFITLEAVLRGRGEVRLKGKTRVVFIPIGLKKKLLVYIKSRNIKEGSVFITKSGKPLDRSNIWSDMKRLCESAGVSSCKVFPHNLRHLFARTFYSIEKDIARLADVLGHGSIETTRIYIMTSGAEHERILSRMRLVC